MTELAAIGRGPIEHSARLTDVGTARQAAVAAARRVIARNGADRLTLDSVAKEAGLPDGVLADYFDNEHEVLLAVAADDLTVLARSMRASARAAEPAVSPELMQSIQALESSFANAMERHQRSLRQRGEMASWVEQCVKDLQQKVDVSESRQSRTRAEVKAALTAEAPAPKAVEPPIPARVAHLIVEPPPLPDFPKSGLGSLPADGFDLPPVVEPQTEHAQSDSEEALSQEAVPMDNYLSDARRAAKSTQANDRDQRASKRRSGRARVLAAAVLGPVAILATAVLVLNRNGVTAMPSPGDPPTTEEVAKVQEAVKAELTPPPQVAVATPSNPTPAQLAATEPVDKLTELAATGDMKAQRDLGLKFLAGDGVQANESEAARWLMRAAYRGEATAEYWLGTLYARGHGVPEDAFQANHWYEAAAKKGNRRAMHSFAVAYFQGWGVEKNYSEAARWFRSAADLGFVDAQFNLAVLYERGAGIQQSLTEAYKWYAIAAANGDKEAEARVAVLATQLAPADLALAQQAAATFKPTPMDQNANLATGAQPTDG